MGYATRSYLSWFSTGQNEYKQFLQPCIRSARLFHVSNGYPTGLWIKGFGLVIQTRGCCSKPHPKQSLILLNLLSEHLFLWTVSRGLKANSGGKSDRERLKPTDCIKWERERDHLNAITVSFIRQNNTTYTHKRKIKFNIASLTHPIH